MATWTKQSGFPVVKVVRQSPTEYIVTQKRFFSNPANEANQTVTDSEFQCVFNVWSKSVIRIRENNYYCLSFQLSLVDSIDVRRRF